MANVRKKAQEKGKVARVPFGTVRLKMQMSPEDMAEFKRRGVVTYWFNDQDGRVERAKAGGYKFVKPEHATSLGQSAIHRGNTDEGSRVSMVVSRGDPVLRAFLMEIPVRFWNQDQKAKADKLLKGEQADPLSGEDTEVQYGPGVTFSH